MNFISLLAPSIASFLITLAVMPVIISLSIKKGYFDIPDGDVLKVHKKPIPVFGGVGIFTGFVIPIISTYYSSGEGRELLGI